MKAEQIEQEFLDHINQAELVQSEDNLWTLGYRRPEDGEFRGCKDFFSMTSAMKYYHQSQLQALKKGINNRIVQLELLIEQKDYESQFLSIKESRIDELKKVLNLITNLDDK